MMYHDPNDLKVYAAKLICCDIRSIRKLDTKTIYFIGQYDPKVYNIDGKDLMVVQNNRKRGLAKILMQNNVPFLTKKRQIERITQNKEFKPFNPRQYDQKNYLSRVKHAFFDIISIFKSLFSQIDWNDALNEALYGYKTYQKKQIDVVQNSLSHVEKSKGRKRQTKNSSKRLQEDLMQQRQNIQQITRQMNQQASQRIDFGLSSFNIDFQGNNMRQSRQQSSAFMPFFNRITPQSKQRLIFQQQGMIDELIDPKDLYDL